MANKIQLKRSSVAGRVPATTDLDLGELALNTRDGKLYTKTSDGSTEAVVQLSVDATVVKTSDTGTVTSTMLADGTIVNGDINASAAIAGSKISPDFGSQTVTTTGVFSADDGTAAAPGITFTGDTNTGIYSPGADQVAISTGGTGRLFVNSDGTVAISQPESIAGVTSIGLRVSSSIGAGSLLILNKSNDGFNPANIALTKSRGTASSPTAVIAGDTAGTLAGYAYDGSAYVPISVVSTVVESSSGAENISGNLQFATRAAGVAQVATERLRITSDGKVGIGISSPSNNLDIAGAGTAGIRARTTDTSGNAVGRLIAAYEGGGGGSYSNVELRAGNGYSYLVNTTNNDMLFGTNGTVRARITSTGNVGIGTTAPASTLHTYGGPITFETTGSTDANREFRFNVDGNNFAWLRVPVGSGGALAVATGAAGSVQERARLDSSGRLLVGTSSSLGGAEQLQVKTTSAANVFGIYRENNDATGPRFCLYKTRGSATSAVSSGDGLGTIRFQGSDGVDTASIGASIDAIVDGTPGADDMPGRLVFSTTPDGASSPTERVRISSSGAMHIGTGGASVDVGGNTTNGLSIFAPGTGSGIFQASNTDNPTAYLKRQGTDGTVVSFRKDTTQVGTISVTTTATAYNTSSDYRLKENVVPLTGAADRLKQLQVHRFNFIADPDTTVDGFIAHEAQQVVPECVTGTKDEVDGEGNPVYQGIDQSKLVPLLTAALQEAMERIEVLEAKVNALEGN